MIVPFIIALLLLTGCSQQAGKKKNPRATFLKGEYISRFHDDSHYPLKALEKNPATRYPWNVSFDHNCPKITKEYFRCNGSLLSPYKAIMQQKETIRIEDCGGSEKHSLPLKAGKEFIYPILIDLLNYIQLKTAKRVVITSGHRCPEHNRYVDDSIENQASKHQIGAEVNFYVQDLENNPDLIIQLLQQYYLEHAQYKDQQAYLEFKRYEKGSTNTSTLPWCNKEVFIKLFKSAEGRNFDNRHPYPYIGIQVRFDRDRNEQVVYTWDKAHRHYHRK